MRKLLVILILGLTSLLSEAARAGRRSMRLTTCLLEMRSDPEGPGGDGRPRQLHLHRRTAPVTVKVFTILGQLISQTTLPGRNPQDPA